MSWEIPFKWCGGALVGKCYYSHSECVSRVSSAWASERNPHGDAAAEALQRNFMGTYHWEKWLHENARVCEKQPEQCYRISTFTCTSDAEGSKIWKPVVRHTTKFTAISLKWTGWVTEDTTIYYSTVQCNLWLLKDRSKQCFSQNTAHFFQCKNSADNSMHNNCVCLWK